MDDLLLIGLAGFFASMVDGALGMGFGPTSAAILLGTGLSPAATSATVNLAKIATGVVAGVSHWRFQNIDRRLVLRLAIPGAGGALVGTTILANVDGKSLRPVLAVLLLVVGLRILVRFSRDLPDSAAMTEVGANGVTPTFEAHGAALAGAAGGATNGLIGAWGPVVTPFLLHSGVPPRYVVGSVNTAEVAVAVVSAGSLMGSLGGAGVEPGVVLAMLGGGVIAAPLAAYVVRFVPARLLGVAVAGLLLLTQSRELASTGLLPVGRWIAYSGIITGLVVAVLRPRLTGDRQQASSPGRGTALDRRAPCGPGAAFLTTVQPDERSRGGPEGARIGRHP